jgi:hypothetical protein
MSKRSWNPADYVKRKVVLVTKGRSVKGRLGQSFDSKEETVEEKNGFPGESFVFMSSRDP